MGCREPLGSKTLNKTKYKMISARLGKKPLIQIDDHLMCFVISGHWKKNSKKQE